MMAAQADFAYSDLTPLDIRGCMTHNAFRDLASFHEQQQAEVAFLKDEAAMDSEIPLHDLPLQVLVRNRLQERSEEEVAVR